MFQLLGEEPKVIRPFDLVAAKTSACEDRRQGKLAEHGEHLLHQRQHSGKSSLGAPGHGRASANRRQGASMSLPRGLERLDTCRALLSLRGPSFALSSLRPWR